MKLDTAIEILNTFTFSSNHTSQNDVNEAIELGIEALGYIKRSRVFQTYPVNEILPGETKS